MIPNHGSWLALILFTTLLLAACSKDPAETSADPATTATQSVDSESGPGVTIDAPTRQRLGLELAVVVDAPAGNVADGLATVLDGAALTATLDDIAAARTEAESLADNMRRLQRLYDDGGNASLQALETARTQLAAARARLTAAESRARADWGATLVDTTDAAARSALADLARGQGALLRAEFAATLKGAAGLRFSVAGGATEGEYIPAHFIGLSRAPTLSTSGVAVTLAVFASDARDIALRPGTRVTVLAADAAAAQRAVVPASAAIADAGALWCYVERGPERFDRITLDAENRVSEGYPAPQLTAGMRVVVRGAPLLLSLERGAGAPPAAED